VAGVLKSFAGLTAAETARDFNPVPYYHLNRPVQVNQYSVKVIKNYIHKSFSTKNNQ
jgi:hypothetical protein